MTQTAFWDKIAPKYARQPIKDMSAYEQTMERVRSHLAAGDHVVELGCGTGATALLLAPHVEHITATDISRGMIAQAQMREPHAENVRFIAARHDEITPPEGGYDVVMAFNLFHLVRDTEAAFEDVNRMLKPGGLFISKTPSLATLNPLLKLLIWTMRRIGKAPFVKMMSVDDLDDAIIHAGFDIVETGTYPNKPPNRFVVARKR
ncbi:MAG: class I SAM-dependent methyltransferase [Pseudomonadota bacterium]